MSSLSMPTEPTAPVVVREPIPSPPWLCEALRRDAVLYLSSLGVPLSSAPPSSPPKLMLQNASTRRWLSAPYPTSATLVIGDPASNGPECKWSLVAMQNKPGVYALQNCHGHFLRADNNDGGFMNILTVKRVDCSQQSVAQEWETFKLAAHPAYPFALTMQSTHGFFVGHHNHNPTNRATVAGDWEMWLPHTCA